MKDKLIKATRKDVGRQFGHWMIIRDAISVGAEIFVEVSIPISEATPAVLDGIENLAIETGAIATKTDVYAKTVAFHTKHATQKDAKKFKRKTISFMRDVRSTRVDIKPPVKRKDVKVQILKRGSKIGKGGRFYK